MRCLRCILVRRGAKCATAIAVFCQCCRAGAQLNPIVHCLMNMSSNRCQAGLLFRDIRDRKRRDSERDIDGTAEQPLDGDGLELARDAWRYAGFALTVTPPATGCIHAPRDLALTFAISSLTTIAGFMLNRQMDFEKSRLSSQGGLSVVDG